MGQGENRVEVHESPGFLKRKLAGEIESIRRELDGLVAELDRRRHDVLSITTQVKRHPLVAVLAVAFMAGVAFFAVTRAARRRGGVQAVGHRTARTLNHPRAELARLRERHQRDERDESQTRRLLGAFVTALAGVLARVIGKEVGKRIALRGAHAAQPA